MQIELCIRWGVPPSLLEAAPWFLVKQLQVLWRAVSSWDRSLAPAHPCPASGYSSHCPFSVTPHFLRVLLRFTFMKRENQVALKSPLDI